MCADVTFHVQSTHTKTHLHTIHPLQMPENATIHATANTRKSPASDLVCPGQLHAGLIAKVFCDNRCTGMSAAHVVSVLGCGHLGCSMHDGCYSCKRRTKRIAKENTRADIKLVQSVLQKVKAGTPLLLSKGPGAQGPRSGRKRDVRADVNVTFQAFHVLPTTATHCHTIEVHRSHFLHIHPTPAKSYSQTSRPLR